MSKKAWFGVAALLVAGIALAQTYTQFSYVRVLNILDVRTSIQNQDSAESVVVDDNFFVTGTSNFTGAITVPSCTGCGGGGTPGGSDTQVQYNDGGAFGGDAGMTYNEATDALTVVGAGTFGGNFTADPGGGSDELTVTSGAVAILGSLSDDGVSIDAATGEFTVTFDDACTTSPTLTVDYIKIGPMVMLHPETWSLGGGSCTSDSTSFVSTGTPVPSAIRPAVNTMMMPVYGGLTNNGSATHGCMYVTTTGNLGFAINASNTCNITGWTNSGGKAAVGGGNMSVAYMITDP